MPADPLLDLVLDQGSWLSWDLPAREPPHDAAYDAALKRAALKSGCDEAVSTGEATIAGRPVAVVTSNFGFLGGSIGLAAASRLARAAEQATRRRLPLLAFPASGGTRMQEGAPGFAAALAITAAVARHRAAGLPYIVYLRHPTFGGVPATWAALGCPLLAEPGASIGFLGPRPYAALGGSGDLSAVQTAANLAAHDQVDAVVPHEELGTTLRGLLDVMSPARPAAVAPRETGRASSRRAGDAWDAVTASRREGRPGLRQVLPSRDVTWLSAGPAGEPGSPLVLATARIGGQGCVIVGQDRAAAAGRRLGTAALRRARRGMRLAEELALPLVTVIDTPGAELSAAAEEDGLALEIGRCVGAMLRLAVPTVAVLLGQGAGGGAIALAAADRLIALEQSWLAPLAPEGASAIVHGHPGQAADLARSQRISAFELLQRGIADLVVPEPTGPAVPPGDIGAAVSQALGDLGELDGAARAGQRYERFRRLADPLPDSQHSEPEPGRSYGTS
ncbi:MAG TPA: carboxyl transferase domain-containing protein [Trebonia sp.]|jgi:acetyl-CoA carboxylase carboxyl transferase subunit beta|nr:carboxyl transferase domain-containing protein [Trebonia sp.]